MNNHSNTMPRLPGTNGRQQHQYYEQQHREQSYDFTNTNNNSGNNNIQYSIDYDPFRTNNTINDSSATSNKNNSMYHHSDHHPSSSLSNQQQQQPYSIPALSRNTLPSISNHSSYNNTPLLANNNHLNHNYQYPTPIQLNTTNLNNNKQHHQQLHHQSHHHNMSTSNTNVNNANYSYRSSFTTGDNMNNTYHNNKITSSTNSHGKNDNRVRVSQNDIPSSSYPTSASALQSNHLSNSNNASTRRIMTNSNPAGTTSVYNSMNTSTTPTTIKTRDSVYPKYHLGSSNQHTTPESTRVYNPITTSSSTSNNNVNHPKIRSSNDNDKNTNIMPILHPAGAPLLMEPATSVPVPVPTSSSAPYSTIKYNTPLSSTAATTLATPVYNSKATNQPTVVPKRKRGRPPKNSKNLSNPSTVATVQSSPTVRKRRGRPPKRKPKYFDAIDSNDNNTNKELPKRKRGRPPRYSTTIDTNSTTTTSSTANTAATAAVSPSNSRNNHTSPTWTSKRRRRPPQLRKHTHIDAVLVEKPFSFQTNNSNNENEDFSNNNNNGIPSDGAYISCTVSNRRRYYGILLDQSSLQKASEHYFQNQVNDLNLNRRMKRLHNNNSNDDDRDKSIPVTTEDETKIYKDHRQVQKFSYIPPTTTNNDTTRKDDTTNNITTDPGYRVLLATYANVYAAAEDDLTLSNLIYQACQMGGNFVRQKYYYQYMDCHHNTNNYDNRTTSQMNDTGVPSKWMTAKSTDPPSKSNTVDIHTSLSLTSFFQHASLPDWFPLGNIVDSNRTQTKILNLLQLTKRFNKHGEVEFNNNNNNNNQPQMNSNNNNNFTTTSSNNNNLLQHNDPFNDDEMIQKSLPLQRKHFRVGIIGAGIAGLACAAELLRLAETITNTNDLNDNDILLEVMLLEAKSHVGGRIKTDYFSSSSSGLENNTGKKEDSSFKSNYNNQNERKNSLPLELGASWIHGIDGNPLTDLANEANLDMINTEDDLKMLFAKKEVDPILDKQMTKKFDQLLDIGAQYCWETREILPIFNMPSTRNNENITHNHASREPQLSVRWYASNLLSSNCNNNNKDGSYLQITSAPAATDVPIHRYSNDISVQKAIEYAQSKEKSNINNNNQGKEINNDDDKGKNNNIYSQSEREQLLEWNTKNIEYALGADIKDLSTKFWASDEEHAFEGKHVMLKQGYSKIVDLLLQRCQRPGRSRSKFTLKTNFIVNKIQYGTSLTTTNSGMQQHPGFRGNQTNLINISNSCRVTSTNNGKEELIDLDFCVCALPLGVLKNSVDWSPSIPVPSSGKTTINTSENKVQIPATNITTTTIKSTVTSKDKASIPTTNMEVQSLDNNDKQNIDHTAAIANVFTSENQSTIPTVNMDVDPLDGNEQQKNKITNENQNDESATIVSIVSSEKTSLDNKVKGNDNKGSPYINENSSGNEVNIATTEIDVQSTEIIDKQSNDQSNEVKHNDNIEMEKVSNAVPEKTGSDTNIKGDIVQNLDKTSAVIGERGKNTEIIDQTVTGTETGNTNTPESEVIFPTTEIDLQMEEAVKTSEKTKTVIILSDNHTKDLISTGTGNGIEETRENKNQIHFYPPLPKWKRDAIDSVGFGLLNKIYVSFPHAFWRKPGSSVDELKGTVFLADDQYSFGNASGTNPHHYMFMDIGKIIHKKDDIFSTHKSLSKESINNYEKKNDANGHKLKEGIQTKNEISVDEPAILLTLISGSAAVSMEQRSDEELKQQIMETLNEIFSSEDLIVPEPSDIKVTRWGSDPFARGCYTFLPNGATHEDYNILQKPLSGNSDNYFLEQNRNPNEPMRLFWAGEHTTSLYPSMAHGAFLSGVRAAIEIFGAMQGNQNKTFEASESKEKNVDVSIPVTIFRMNHPTLPLQCQLCKQIGSRKLEGSLTAFQRGTRQVLVHVNCAQYCPEVERVEDTWRNVIKAVNRGKSIHCVKCKKTGGVIGCNAANCNLTHHLKCCEDDGWSFERDGKRFFCTAHRHLAKTPTPESNASNAIMSKGKNRTVSAVTKNNTKPSQNCPIPSSKAIPDFSSYDCALNFDVYKKMDPKTDLKCMLCGKAEYIVGEPHSGLKAFFNAKTCQKALVHIPCIRYSKDVTIANGSWETDSGLFKDLISTVQKYKSVNCALCCKPGASIACTSSVGQKYYHYLCAQDQGLSLSDNSKQTISKDKAQLSSPAKSSSKPPTHDLIKWVQASETSKNSSKKEYVTGEYTTTGNYASYQSNPTNNHTNIGSLVKLENADNEPTRHQQGLVLNDCSTEKSSNSPFSIPTVAKTDGFLRENLDDNDILQNNESEEEEEDEDESDEEASIVNVDDDSDYLQENESEEDDKLVDFKLEDSDYELENNSGDDHLD